MEIIHESKFQYLGKVKGMYAFINRDCSTFDPSIKLVTKAEYRHSDGSKEYFDYSKGPLTKEEVVQRIEDLMH